MFKQLRSLLLESFPEELRFKIELLSRRRDISNKEKQEEIFTLLRDFKVEGITPLGPGTNRYAFKINGFVVKVATDNDGKIDNFKEFKMSKRLYPDVTKIYEVSRNGTLLVAEYIQPFSSYAEMYQYADKIRAKLKRLSSTYLIGDVGITSKNYANWGLRVGSDEPVCLDFAYIYDVTSELFVCKYCNSNSMLVPDDNFVNLICPNRGCGHKYDFSEIRRRLGNDIHNHEIGDLTEEGYVLYESNSNVELDEKRSGYLYKKDKETVKVVEEEEEIPIDNFQVETNLNYTNKKEDTTMSNVINTYVAANAGKTNFRGRVIQAKVINTTPVVNEEPETTVEEQPVTKKIPTGSIIEEPQKVNTDAVDGTELAFSGSVMSSSSENYEEDEACDYDTNIGDEELTESEQAVMEAMGVTAPVSAPLKATEEVEVEAGVPVETDTIYPEEHECHNCGENCTCGNHCDEQQEIPVVKFDKNFIKYSYKILSTLANAISAELHTRYQVYDEIKHDIKEKKLYAEEFYNRVGNAVYKSLFTFCNFQQKEIKNRDNDGTHMINVGPTDIIGEEYEPTMRFMERLFINDGLCNVEEADTIMENYIAMYDDYQGIQREWIKLFKERLSSKLNISNSGLNKLADAIAEVWCVPEEEMCQEAVDAAMWNQAMQEAEAEYDGSISPSIQEQIKQAEAELNIPENPSEEDINNALLGAAQTGFSQYMNEPTGEPSMEEAYDQMINQEAGDEYQDPNEEEDNTASRIYVTISAEDTMDIIKLNASDAYGEVAIPFYTKLTDVNENQTMPSIVDDRNGMWDWLAHICPDLMFRTKDPERWLNMSNEETPHEDQIHIVILDGDDENGYIMGVYSVAGIYFIDDEDNYIMQDDETVLRKINKVFTDVFNTSPLSHLSRSLMMVDELAYDESDIEAITMSQAMQEDDENNEEEPAEEVGPSEEELQEEAALEAMGIKPEENQTFAPIRRRR